MVLILGDSWKDMPPSFVSYSVKRITQILVIAKLNEKKFFWEALFVISSIPSSNYLFKVSYWITRKNSSRLRMKTLERCKWRRSSVVIVNCDHISNFVLNIDFEQANVCYVHMEKINTFDSLISIGQYLLTHGYRFIWLDDLTCLNIICKNENTVGEHG